MSQQTKDLVEEPVTSAAPGPAKLALDGKEYELPVTVGSEGEVGIDIQQLRAQSGAITLDPGYGNTGACESAITFIDGEAGILRYRGYPIEEIAGNAQFTEICYLLIYGRLPSQAEFKEFEDRLTYHTLLHEDMKKFFEGFPSSAHPMAMLSSMVASLSAYYPDGTKSVRPRPEHRAAARQGADHRGVLLQEEHRPAVHVPAQRPRLRLANFLT